MLGERSSNYLKVKEIYQTAAYILRHSDTYNYTLRESAVRAEMGRSAFSGAMGMRDWVLLTTIMVAGFGFTLGKLAFDEWRIKRGQRNHGAGP